MQISATSAANSTENWNKLWAKPEETEWRALALDDVYCRIGELCPRGARIIDIGGGTGTLATLLKDSIGSKCTVVDHSDVALEQAKAAGHEVLQVDLEATDFDWLRTQKPDVIVATEVLEHLSDRAVAALLTAATEIGAKCFFSVPNDRLGPDEEPQHARKWTALGFLKGLRQHFTHTRVEVLGPPAVSTLPSDRSQPAFLLGVCGFPKRTPLSVCFPARDEAADIEKTLASFRGVADELVVGVDPRSVDATKEIAEKYADVVFDLTEMRGPPGDEVAAENGVHFAHIRNQCIDRCTNEWFFMTEAHESLWRGQDTLLNFYLPEEVAAAKVCQVIRVGGPAGARQQWAFPWMAKKDPKIRYIRAVHNSLDFPDGTLVLNLPNVKTLHERVHEQEVRRAAQRKAQNRCVLMEDWLKNQNENSLFYLGSEWRGLDNERAIKWLREYLQVNRNNGPLRYHTRLVLAKTLWEENRTEEAKEILFAAPQDDWCRVDHWVFLGDLCFNDGAYEQAAQYYQYAATRLLDPPITVWWIDLAFYSWIPAQRLAQTYGELGQLQKALAWAERVVELHKIEGSPLEFVEEAETNVSILRELLGHEPGRQQLQG